VQEDRPRPHPSCALSRSTAIGPRKTSPNGHPYIECETDEGNIAFWGGENNLANITVVSRL
jgi:hypothetical protein